MTARIATLVTPQPWEERLVRDVRDSGVARVVGRTGSKAEIERLVGVVDAVFLDDTAPWLTGSRLRHWTTKTLVVGVGTARRTPLLSACSDVRAPGELQGVITEIAGDLRSIDVGSKGGRRRGTVGVFGPSGGVRTIANHLATALSDDVTTVPWAEVGLGDSFERSVLVCRATASSLRAVGAVLADWWAPPPLVAVIGCRGEHDLRAVRAATGLEPTTTLPPVIASSGMPDALRPLVAALERQSAGR